MPLPILNTISTDLIRLFHQTERDWTRHLAEEALLDVGTAFHNAELQNVWDANCLFDAALPEGMNAADALALVEAHYASLGLRCRRWVMNPSVAPERTAPLLELLIARGVRTDRFDILHLDGSVASRVAPASEMPGIKIIPARASYRHARQLAEEMTQSSGEPQLVEATILHLEDPHFDSLLALKEGRAIAMAGVLAMGEIGRIEKVFVSEPFRRQGLGRVMMTRVMEICLRALFKHVLLSVDPANAPAQALYREFGFQRVGEQVVHAFP